MPESPESSRPHSSRPAPGAAFAPSAFAATLFAEWLTIAEWRELDDFEADAELEVRERLGVVFVGRIAREVSSNPVCRPRMESFEPLAAIRPRVVPPERNGSSHRHQARHSVPWYSMKA